MSATGGAGDTWRKMNIRENRLLRLENHCTLGFRVRSLESVGRRPRTGCAFVVL